MYGDNDAGKDKLKVLMNNEFVMMDLGNEKTIPGMEIWRDRRVAWFTVLITLRKSCGCSILISPNLLVLLWPFKVIRGKLIRKRSSGYHNT